MNKFGVVLTAAGVLAFVPGAMAADVAPAVGTSFDWTGFYLGANAGYGWSDNNAQLKGLGGSAWDPYYPDALGSILARACL